ncbi:MAG: DnaJ domain-containing protein [Clostridia bacterium]|jgi:uncharacterized membrane protein
MAFFRLPRLPDRQAIQQFLLILQPRAGRITGALSGMILAGPAWLYGLCVGILLGYMIDTVRAKTASGSTGTASETSQTGSGNTEADAYQQLGLLPGASIAEVKKAWRVRSRKAHPDAPGGAAEDFMALKSAYEKILAQLKDDPAVH